jgi:predicted house-cleaning noncanonical NTP pyrophosphatase (MazG superfamily)
LAQYNKLVRDQVPGTLRASGRKVVTRTIVGKELQKALRAALEEAVAEYDAAPDDERAASALADLQEITAALGRQRGCTEAQLTALRSTRTAQRGSYDRGVLLVEVN